MNLLNTVLHEIEAVMALVDQASVAGFARALHQHEGRVFLIGEGRSGLMAKAFAMRLMHLGANVYVVGETITPAVEKGDMIVAISGSGTTRSVIDKAEKARDLGCEVVCLTADLNSSLASISTLAIHIPAATKYRKTGETPSTQPLGSLFDQSTHIVLDVVCLEFSRLRAQSNEIAVQRHSNLE